MKQMIVLVLLAMCFLLLSGMSLLTGKYYLSSFEGKVVDAETKEPIEGAAVLAVYFKETFSPAGSNHYAVDAQETLTGTDGQFKIPSKAGRSDDYRGRLDCNLIIFKPGYGVFPNHRLSSAVGENKSWPPPEKYIVYELPKLKTKDEISRNAFEIKIDYDLQFNKQKIIINAVNKEFESLGLLDRYINKKGKPALILKERSK